MPPSRWASVDYALDWPRELLADELVALCGAEDWPWTPADVARLLREAFHSTKPVAVFERVSSTDDWFHFSVGPDGDRPAPPAGQTWINELLGNLHQLREHRTPRPLWRQRQQKTRQANASLPPPDAREAVAGVMTTLFVEGYLDERYPRGCVTDEDFDSLRDPRPPSDRLREDLAELLGSPVDILWPPKPAEWDDGLFYDLVEAWHDLVSRPRRQWLHEEGECGEHFGDFDTDAGRRIYRTLVNRAMTTCGVELRIADSGEDEGRLVHVTDEARGDLVDRALASPDPQAADEIGHAISLFRRRDATTHDKRSAVVALANVLEDRKRLLEARLFSADEDALFHIANRFDLRHRNEKQHTDYDPAFRDWVFWWYLATIELPTESSPARPRHPSPRRRRDPRSRTPAARGDRPAPGSTRPRR